MNMFERAKWSDAFFGYVPAEQASGEFWTIGDNRGSQRYADLLTPVAQQFLEVNSDCPMTVKQLVDDYIKRA
jgi:hypothetical protein